MTLRYLLIAFSFNLVPASSRDIHDTDGQTQYFGGIRPGCYLDMTPVGGLLVMSDGAAGCGCSYINQCTIALQPVEKEESEE